MLDKNQDSWYNRTKGRAEQNVQILSSVPRGHLIISLVGGFADIAFPPHTGNSDKWGL